MTTFEYAIIFTDGDNVVQTNSTGTSGGSDPLNAAGAAGWELVAITHPNDGNLATFKRPTGTVATTLT